MSVASEGSLFVDSDEDVVEVELAPFHGGGQSGEARTTRSSQFIPPDHLPGLADMLNEGHRGQQQGLRASSRDLRNHHHHHRRHHHHHHHHHHRHRPAPLSRQNQTATAVIDLTEEPDSPVEVQPSRQSSQSQSQGGSNPRRTVSQRISPPTLARSDGTINRSSMPDVIDLTVDSPEDDRAMRASARFRQQRNYPRPLQPQVHPMGRDALFSVGLVQTARQRLDLRGFSRRLAGFFNADIMALGINPGPEINIPPLDPQSARSSPKPPMEPTPPTREGFTRDTCAEPKEEMVVVCPNCNEELAFDPTSQSQAPAPAPGPSKGTKRKRGAAENHFWALKKCGHVYCADCFENRRPTKSNRQGVGFPGPEGKDPYTAVNELRCAVAGCDTKVAMKGEWVGLYA